MALIKCSECGQMVSDKASSCPNCGCPIEKRITCSECGGEIGDNDIACPSCGCPIEGKKQQSLPHTQNEKKSENISDEKKKKIQQFLVRNRKYLPQERMESVRSQLLSMSEEQWAHIEWLNFKDPTTMLIISVVVGYFGVDRFILGDATNGALKLVLTILCGVGLIWWIVDIFKINDMTLEYNYKQLAETMSYA